MAIIMKAMCDRAAMMVKAVGPRLLRAGCVQMFLARAVDRLYSGTSLQLPSIDLRNAGSNLRRPEGHDERHFSTSFHRQRRGRLDASPDWLTGPCADRLANQIDQDHRRLSGRRADRFVCPHLRRVYPGPDRPERDRGEP